MQSTSNMLNAIARLDNSYGDAIKDDTTIHLRKNWSYFR